MSRIGKKPIIIDNGVTVVIEEKLIHITGPKGKVVINIPKGTRLINSGNSISIEVQKIDNPKASSLIGLTRTLIQNAIIGVTKGWSKTLELMGVGYRAETIGEDLTIHVGYSHPVEMTSPKGIQFAVAENKIVVSGCDKYIVGEVAASIRRIKPPEPYKGKGIRYAGEVIRKKLGKAAKAVGGGVTGGASGGAK